MTKLPSWGAAISAVSVMMMTAVGSSSSFASGGGFDRGIADHPALIKMLERSGKIQAGASQAEANAVLEQYLADKEAAAASVAPGEFHSREHKHTTSIYNKLQNVAATVHTEVNNSGALPPVQLEAWNGEQRQDHVLAILIEFPDYGHNDVTADLTSNYYDDYNTQHYQDLLFSPTGYMGSNGENSLTMKQYYEQQSGLSYTVDGKAVGWFTASQPASFYGDNANQTAVRQLVAEALVQVAQQPNFDWDYFDQEDRYDLDGDGNYREPDGLVDHLMIFHSSVGEEAGGGALGEDAIWSHRWNLGGVFAIPGTSTPVPYWGGLYGAYDYTIQPVDAAVGVCAHEYGHDLNLPDEYDTQYSGLGETVSYWSIMSSGSWAGRTPGYEPTGFSPWAKEFLQAAMPGSNWFHPEVRNQEDFDYAGTSFVLDQANDKGTNPDALRINLPPKLTLINTPHSGNGEYWSTRGDNLSTGMSVQLDLTSSSSASVNFKAWYEIETDWDYAYVEVNGQPVAGNLTTNTNPNGSNRGNGITGFSDGWVDGDFDLSAYVGAPVVLTFHYVTDAAATENGIFIDDIAVTVDGSVVLSDDAEGASPFSLHGFVESNGQQENEQYYLIEVRNHKGVDEGLAHVQSGNYSYEPGLLVWYVDSSYYFDNAVGNHPGEGWLGVVDADIHPMYWSDGAPAETRYQLRDATFSLTPLQQPMSYSRDGRTVTDLYPLNYSRFFDWDYYMNPWIPQAGRKLPFLGLGLHLEAQAADGSTMQFRVNNNW